MRQFKILRLIFHVLAMAAITSQGQAALANPPEIQFNRDIRPILSDNCFYCHGPDKNHREAELRLDDRDAALKAGVIKPGMPGESELVARIRSADKDELIAKLWCHFPNLSQLA